MKGGGSIFINTCFYCRLHARTMLLPLLADVKKWETSVENYQEQRLETGIAPATVDKEVSIAKTMVAKAFDDDRIGGDVLKTFRTVKKKLKKGANARARTQNGIAFHNIRRTVKTNMARAGASMAYRDKLLGHAPQGMDARYMALDEDDLRQAMDLFTAWLDGQLTTVDHQVKRAS